jgi:hypothetical protein
MSVLLAHMQCGGTCYTPPTITTPPCHQHAPDSKQPASQSNSPCSQQSVVASKVSGPGRVILEPVALLPIPFAREAANLHEIASTVPETPPGATPLIVSISILRI